MAWIPDLSKTTPIVMRDLEWSPGVDFQALSRLRRRPLNGRPKQTRKKSRKKLLKAKPIIYFFSPSAAREFKSPSVKDRRRMLKRQYLGKKVREDVMAKGELGVVQGMTIIVDRLRPEPLKFKTPTQKELKRKKQKRARTGRR